MKLDFCWPSTAFRQLSFYLQVITVGDSFWVRDGSMGLLLLSDLGPHLMKAHAESVHVATISVSSNEG